MSVYEQRLENPDIGAILQALEQGFAALAPGEALILRASGAPDNVDWFFTLEHLGFGNVQLIQVASFLEVRARKLTGFNLARFKRLVNLCSHTVSYYPAKPSEADSKITIIIDLDTNEADLQDTVRTLESQECAEWRAIVNAASLPNDLCSHPKISLGSATSAKGEFIMELRSGDKLHSRFLKQALALLESDGQLDFIYSHTLYNGKNAGLVYLPVLSNKIKASEITPVPALFRQRTWRHIRDSTSACARSAKFWSQLDCKNGKLIPEPLCSLNSGELGQKI